MSEIINTSSNDSSNTQPQEEIVKGQKLPAEILDIVLRAQDRSKTSLREILEKCEDGILVCVHTKGSKKRLHEEAIEFFNSEGYPHVKLTYMGVTAYPPSVNAALARLAEEAISAEEPPLLLSDPRFLLIGAMGYVRPPAASKAWEKRFSREGPIRRGFFVIRKDGTLYSKRAGTMPNMLEQIVTVKSRFHKEWVAERRKQGLPIPPW